MADTPGPSSDAITLPTGGGALRGLGETFTPDPFTGTGNFTVPIALPPGRGGMQPQLNLVYSTGYGNGPFGLGWSLSVPGVARKTSTGLPRYDDERDVFVLSGTEDLVPLPARVGDRPNRRRYRPRTEGLFARIERELDAASDFWEVATTDGTISRYGTDSARGADPAAIARRTRPGGARDVFAWKLTETRDSFGNRVRYEYVRDAGVDGPHEWDQLYLASIEYVDVPAPGGGERFLVTVAFEYDARDDPSSDHRATFEIRTRRRCRAIRISTDAETFTRVRDYELRYDTSAANGVSLLQSVVVAAYADPDANGVQAIERFPPLEFRHTRFEPAGRRFVPLTGDSLPAQSLAAPDLELVDLFGRGLPDFLEINNGVRYWRNRGHGTFDPPRPMRHAPEGFALEQAGVQLIDADGDGRSDLLVTTESVAGYFPLAFSGEWDQRSFRHYRTAPTVSLHDPAVRLIDLDGDGVTDAIRSGTRLECFFNDPGVGWRDTRWIERRPPEEFPDVDFSDARVKTADMTGDGLQDIVFVHDRSVDYWPNLGYGDWGRRIRMRNAPHLPLDYDPARLLAGDVDGDGLADLVYVGDREVTLWINRGGNGFAPPTVITGTPPVGEGDSIRIADMFGTGIGGVLWSRAATPLRRRTLWFLDFTGGVKPYLLSGMTNNLGATIEVSYTTSTSEYLRDDRAEATRWRAPLPYPVHVVDVVSTVDAFSRSKLTTRYRYHQGCWDGAEREFRGFGIVDQIDSDTFAGFHEHADPETTPFAPVASTSFAPPTLTRRWFHQGPIGEARGEWAEPDHSAMFWPGDPPLLGHNASIDGFLSGGAPGVRPLNRRAQRDALRTLRGRPIRTEVYALDDDAERRDRPCRVTESAYALVEIEPPSMADAPRPRIFFPHQISERSTEWERGDDPMTSCSFTSYERKDPAGARVFDEYGRPASQTSVALPRRSARHLSLPGAAPGTGVLDETRILATHTRTDYAVPSSPDAFIYDRVSEESVFELRQPPVVAESDAASVLQVLADGVAAAHRVRDIFAAFSPAAVRLAGHTLNYYDGDAFDGLPLGTVERRGALMRTEVLTYTDAELETAYGPARPAYLGGTGTLPVGAPAGFGGALGFRPRVLAPTLAGYYVDSVARMVDDRGLTIAKRDALGSQTMVVYDRFQWLPAQTTDAAGNVTMAENNYRALQPRLVTDPNGNRTVVEFSALGVPSAIWVAGRPLEMDGDRTRAGTRFEYDMHAFEATRFDPAPSPVVRRTIRYVHHDSTAGVPAAERDLTLEQHDYYDGFGRLLQTRTREETLRFGDARFGGGDAVLPMPQAGDPGAPVVGTTNLDPASPNVIVSGWQVYDNKGNVVEQFEPFFSTGWDYAVPGEQAKGQRTRTFYDARGRAVRTISPDGSEQRTIFGVPADLTDPDRFAPTPWERFAYDANDLAPLSLDATTVTGAPPRTLAAHAAVAHHFTPSSTLVNALGYDVATCRRNGAAPSTDWLVTRTRFDLRGNVVGVRDPLGRDVFEYHFDFAGRRLSVRSLDAGVRTSVFDAAGRLVELRDSKGSVVLRRYDTANRLVEIWAASEAQQAVTLRERIEMVDMQTLRGFTAAEAQGRNLVGRSYRHYDEAGVAQCDRYDLAGNLLEKTRRVVSDDAIAAGFVADWSAAGADAVLETSAYAITSAYDALNRVTAATYPADAAGQRAVVVPRYNRAAGLESVTLDQAPYVRHIAYNAKGQRVLVVYGNGLITRYAYDPRTFRLTRLRTERAAVSTALDVITPAGGVLQDLEYRLDLIGNVVTIVDRAPRSGVRNNPDQLRWAATDAALSGLVATGDALVRELSYDPLYRLRSATGREAVGIGAPRPWSDYQSDGYYAPGAAVANQDNAPDVTVTYAEDYEYDAADNMLAMTHWRAGATAWRRRFGMGGLTPAAWAQEWPGRLNAIEWTSPHANAVTHVGDDRDTLLPTHRFDPNGNLTEEQADRLFSWDYSDRLVGFLNRPAPGALASIDARYLYGAGGARVKKWVRRGGTGARDESTVYVEGMFEHARWRVLAGQFEHTTVHVMDNQSRLATVRAGTPHPDDAGPAVQYHFGDHLGSSAVVVGGTDAVGSVFVNREELFPWGDTSFGSFGRKRYRLSGKERDQETGLTFAGARYYSSWTTRWVSCDPAGSRRGAQLYCYVNCRPTFLHDPSGAKGVAPPSVGPAATELARQALGRGGATAGTEIVAGGGAAAAAGVLLGFVALIAGLVVTSVLTQQQFADRVDREAEIRRAAERQRQQALIRQARVNFGQYLLDHGLITEEQHDLYLRTGSVTYRWNARCAGSYWLTGRPEDMYNSDTAYQVYVYRNQAGEVLYIGKAGGAGGLNPDSWVDRLRAHLRDRRGFLLESDTVTVTAGLSEMEAFALEQDLIRQYPEAANVAEGEFSKRFPEADLAANVRRANQATQYKFQIDVHMWSTSDGPTESCIPSGL